MLNPYNREPFDIHMIERFNKLMLYSKWLQIPIELNIETAVSSEKTIEFRILAVFQTIEELGFYTNPQWVYELSTNKLVKFGGWGINLDMTKINIKLKIKNSFSYIAFSSSWLTS